MYVNEYIQPTYVHMSRVYSAIKAKFKTFVFLNLCSQAY